MDPQTALSRLEELIAEEREAIRTINAGHIDQLGIEKESLMKTLAESGVSLPADLTERFQVVVKELKQNGVLLVHARNCLRDVIQLVAAPAATYSTSGTAKPVALRGGRVSVTG